MPDFPFRIGLLGGLALDSKPELQKRGVCNLASGDLYQYPNATSTVDATQPVTFHWDTDCAMDDFVDLYLYEPSSANGLIQVWQNAQFSDGKYTAILRPKWWNDTTTANLQLNIMNHGDSAWDSTSPPGPVFKVTYPADKMFTTTTVNGQAQTNTAAAAATNTHDAVFQNVSNNGQGKSGISKGGIAAAVIVPLLALGAIAAIAVIFWRKRESEKLKRWSQALSGASNLEWEKGARPGEQGQAVVNRPNTQFSATRPSSQFNRPMSQFSGRPASHATSSVYAVENNMAGAGAAGNFPVPHAFAQQRSHSADNLSTRSSVVMPDGQVRQSRISFAETTRGDRRSRLSVGDGLTRPNIGGRLPAGSRSAEQLNLMGHKKTASYATGSAIGDDEETINVSPSQLQGPNAWAEAEMRRAANGKKMGKKGGSGGGGSRRNSTTSALSADDFKSAASARGSVDELRDMEASVLARRSQISLSSRGSPAADSGQFDHNQVESLSPSPSPHSAGSGGATSTVAYGPDQMLAVYAARGKVNAAAAPAPGDMRSYVHLNNGTAPANAIHGLPAPGPNGSHLAIPPQGWNAGVRMSAASATSAYSDGDNVGEAK